MPGNALAAPPKKRAAGLYTIITIKLGKGLLLFLLAIGFFSLAGKDLPEVLDKVLRSLNLDPEQQFFVALGNKIESVTPANLRWVASGTLLYALLLFVEGIGLSARAWWAMWLAIGETAFFIPIEIFDLLHHYSIIVTIILIINLIIVLYLVHNRQRLFGGRHGPIVETSSGQVDYREE